MLVTQASAVACGAFEACRHGMFYYRSDASLMPFLDIGDWPYAARQYGLPHPRERIEVQLRTVNENASSASVRRHPTWLPEQYDGPGTAGFE
jgi:hypothetical protein